MIHKHSSPLAGQKVIIKKGVKHPQVKDFGGAEFVVEDWVDRVIGQSWMFADGNPACLIYAIRSGLTETSMIDNEVLYGKVGPLGHLVHISEIDESEVKP